MPLYVKKSTLEDFFAMTIDEKKAFIAFLRHQLRLEECREKTPSDDPEADEPEP